MVCFGFFADKSIWQATENFKKNLKQEVTEDENLAYFISKMDPKVGTWNYVSSIGESLFDNEIHCTLEQCILKILIF